MKRVISLLCIVILCLVLSMSVFAQTPRLDRECSLTLQYANEGVGFENLNISLYKVASVNADGTFEQLPPFDIYDISINNIVEKSEWTKLATTLSGYIVADSIAPTSSAYTNSLGEVKFSHLSSGLYLIDGVTGENEKGTYTFEPFMMSLPNPDGEEYECDVVAKPKAFEFEPLPEGTTYQVLKLWEDAGYTDKRPDSVKVDIVKDGEIFETITLSADNNWSYAWTDNGKSEWNVVERDVKQGYAVTVDKKTTCFVITNKYVSDTTPQTPPSGFFQTGYTRVLWPYMLIFCLSGMILIIAGLLPLRGYKYEEKNR